MSADVDLIVVDSTLGAVVAQRWIGSNDVRDRVYEVLRRPPDHEHGCFASWGRVTLLEVSHIREAHYGDDFTSADLEQLAVEFGGERFWWALSISW